MWRLEYALKDAEAVSRQTVPPAPRDGALSNFSPLLWFCAKLGIPVPFY